MRGTNGPRFTSWQLRDIRTVVSGFEYVATITIRAGAAVGGDAGTDCDEIWSNGPSGWSVNSDRLAELIMAG